MKYEFTNGSCYEGDMVDEEFHGKGTFYFYNGDKYEGEFVNGMFHGIGEYTYKSGSVYRGCFSRDMFHGIGTLTFDDGAIEKGKFHQDKRVGKFCHLDESKYYWIIYDKDRVLKCDEADASIITEDKKPT
jgi:hypothetical protein